MFRRRRVKYWFKSYLKTDLPWYIRWRPSVRRWLRDTEDRIAEEMRDKLDLDPYPGRKP